MTLNFSKRLLKFLNEISNSDLKKKLQIDIYADSLIMYHKNIFITNYFLTYFYLPTIILYSSFMIVHSNKTFHIKQKSHFKYSYLLVSFII